MEDNSYHIEELKNYFKNNSGFTAEEVMTFYRRFFPNISLIAVNTRISRLTNNGILSRIARGVYSIETKNSFKPIIEPKLNSLFKQIKIQFPSLKFCIWHTSWFAQFMVHQPNIYYTIIETESDNELRTLYSQSVFDYLKGQHKTIFHNPDATTIQNYVSDNKNSIIVIPMISEAPLQKLEKISTVTLEKMLVDIYCEENLFAAQQGSERMNIFKGAFENYSINTTKLLRYAARRSKKSEIERYLKSMEIIN